MPEIDADRFILENLDSVPHLEALILLWNSRPVSWTREQLASRLYITPESVSQVLRDLERLQIVRQPVPGQFTYATGSERRDELMRQVDHVYRKDLVRISTMIHSKASSAVREFARAFRLKKERE